MYHHVLRRCLLPFVSSNVQCTTEVPCVVLVSGSLVVPVIVPTQLSVVVGAEVWSPSTGPSHPPIPVSRLRVILHRDSRAACAGSTVVVGHSQITGVLPGE